VQYAGERLVIGQGDGGGGGVADAGGEGDGQGWEVLLPHQLLNLAKSQAIVALNPVPPVSNSKIWGSPPLMAA
jgi:hypothetical protein